ncbi:hypothetical protein FDZ71_05000, partial [bacterium]
YKIKASSGEFVATIYERADLGQVSKILKITAQLGVLGLPVPAPRLCEGEPAVILRQKPASLTPFVEGRQVLTPNRLELASLGETLAALHLKAADLGRDLPEGLFCWKLLEVEVEKGAARRPDMAAEMIAEARRQALLPEKSLPAGFIHADLFPDNVIFEAKSVKVAAILDFFMAGRGPFVFDLAACALGGCFSGGKLDSGLWESLLGGYGRVRRITDGERAVLLPYLRRAALRYLCLRIEREGEKRAAGSGKDPQELYERLLSLKN